MIDRVISWLRRWNATDLPCGCLAYDGKPPKYSDATSSVDTEIVDVGQEQYANCTVTEHQWRETLQCDHCGATWEYRRSAGREITWDGDPDAGVKLEISSNRFESDTEVPVIEGGDRA